MNKIAFLLIVASSLTGILCLDRTSPPFDSFGTLKTESGFTHQILNFLPLAKLEKIENDHQKNDDGFKAAILYLQGSDWTHLVDNVIKSPEFKNFSNMALKYKFNLTQAISCVRDHIASLKVTLKKSTAKPDLKWFIADIHNALPVDEIIKVFVNPSTKIPQVQIIREKIGTKENQLIAQKLHNLQDMVKIREVLKKMNFDIEPYIALAYTFFGWSQP